MTEPVPPPLFQGSATDLWHSARAVGDEPDLAWTFPAFVHRVLASSPHGLDLAYEYLQGWEHTVGFHKQEEVLAEGYLGDLLLTHRGMGLGLAVHDSFLNTSDGILDRPRLGDKFRGRHHVAAVGVTGSGRIILRNSWGEAWGRRGYGYIGRAYFEAYVEEVTVTYPSWLGWSPKSSRVLNHASGFFREASSRSLMAAAAATPNPIHAKTVKLGTATLNVRMRRVMSSASGRLLDLLELRTEEGDFLARGHLLHDEVAGQGMVMELWVPPVQRRKGYGSALLGELIRLAKADPQLRGITVALFEADSSLKGDARARSFMFAHHFSWLGGAQKRPPIRDFARLTFAGR